MTRRSPTAFTRGTRTDRTTFSGIGASSTCCPQRQAGGAWSISTASTTPTRLSPRLATAKFAGHGTVQEARRRRSALADDQCRYRHDHPEAIPENDEAYGPRRGALSRDADAARRHRESGLRPEQTGLCEREDPRHGRQFWLRLEPRACALGAARLRHSLRHRNELRRHILQ